MADQQSVTSLPQVAEQDPQVHDQAGDVEEVGPAVPSNRSRPDAHTQRYDRQLRLWASSGQASLESSHVLLVGATHLGAQVLKNLILPGIGAFTVLDGQKVGVNDLGNNFFLEPESEGKDRAREVAKYLSELNPSVKSHARVGDAASLLAVEPQWFESFSLIIAVNQPPAVLLPLADIAWQARSGLGIPLMSVRGAGLVGHVQVQVKEMGIIETHPASTVDLRLTMPWPELDAYAQSYDIANRDAMAHSHIPFIVILLRVLEDWKSEHSGSLPTPSTDRKALADRINALRDPTNLDTENFDEAIAALGQNVWRPIASGGRKVPREVEVLFSDPACTNVTAKSTNFWLLTRALQRFVAAPAPNGGDGHLPLPGSLPDFKAESSTYVQVQRLYKDKAQQDLSNLKHYLHAVLREVNLPLDAIADSEIESFAKHAAYVKLIRGQSLRERRAAAQSEVAAMAFMDPINPPTLQNHLALLAVDEFYARHRRFPGSTKFFSDSIIGAGAAAATTTTTAGANFASSTPSSSTTASPTATARLAATRLSPWRSDGGGGGGEPDRKRQKSESPFCSDSDGDARMGDDVKSSMQDESAASVDFEKDAQEVVVVAQRLCGEWGIEEAEHVERVENAVREICRSGHADIASTASLVGGVAAQEAIKLITKQYIPLESMAIYDGIKGTIGSFAI